MDQRKPLREIMTSSLHKVDQFETLEQVARIFEKFEVHHIPVVSEKDRLVGIISKTDFLKLSYGMSLFGHPKRDDYNNALYKSTLAREVMTKMVVSLDPDDTVNSAAQIFEQNLFHAIPIVENEKLVGIITTYDLIKFAFN